MGDSIRREYTMSLRTRLALAIAPELRREATESDVGWRGGAGTSRDLPYADVDKQLRDADDAYRHNPLAFRIVELSVDYVLGKGLSLIASTARAQNLIDEWWNHPSNNWPERQFDLARELALAGDVFITLHTNPFDRSTAVRFLPALLVDQIELNPEDLEDERRYHQLAALDVTAGLSWSTPPSTDYSGTWWTKLPADPAGIGPTCRHYAINRLPGCVRGQSDLLPILPWLTRYRDWLMDRVRINRYKGAYLWDVTIAGADTRAVARRQQELALPPTPGSILIHNEKEVWKPIQPQIAAESVEADGHALRLMVAAGAGVPLHFLAEGESATRATAREMGGPTLRKMERRQRALGAILVDLAREALRRSGRIEDVQSLTIRAEFEDLTTEDNERLANASYQVAQSLDVARRNGWIRDDECRRLLARFLGEPVRDDGLLPPGARLPPPRPAAQPTQPATRGPNGTH